jgi:hypothetical protein
MAAWSRGVALMLAALALAACEDEPSVIRLVIGTDDEVDVSDDLDEIDLTLTASRTEEGNLCEPVTRAFPIDSADLVPLSVVVEQGDDYTAWFAFRVVARLEGVELARVEAKQEWAGPGPTQVAVELQGDCFGVACAEGEVCVDGDCEASPEGAFLDDPAFRDEGVSCNGGGGVMQ